jgi:RND family efflux transporter MFP subunit
VPSRIVAAVLSCSALAHGDNTGAGAGTRSQEPALGGQEIRAQLTPRRFATLAAEIGAKISAIGFVEGSSFPEGAVLLRFDCDLQAANERKARAELKAAEDTLGANTRLAELNSVSKLELALSRSALEKAKAEVGVHEAVRQKCTIRAPYPGKIAEQRVREQQFVQPGEPLLDILDDSVLELEFLVPSSWLLWVRGGQTFNVSIDETGSTYPARFVRIGSRVDPVSQSVKVAAAIDGSFPDLVAGMSGRVHLAPPATP